MNQRDLRRLDSQIYDALRKTHPQSVRHVFYLMTNPNLEIPVEKTERGYKLVQRRLVYLRREGVVPYHWIVDETRRGEYWPEYTSPSEPIHDISRRYQQSIWTDEKQIQVWCESRSIAGVIRDTCREWQTPLYAAGGFSSISFVYEAAGDACIAEELVVLYVGDFDPAGLLIDRSIKEEFVEQGVYPDFRRIAINNEQIDKYNLPEKPRKRGERRMTGVQSTVEAEAMPVELLNSLLVTAIQEHLDDDRVEEARLETVEIQQKLGHLASYIEKNGLDQISLELGI